MELLQTVFSFIVTLGVLVSIHEYGHFIVARWCGVTVLRFSIGFGKTLYSWNDKKGTEFVISVIPLGGYVKMLDERIEEVSKDQLAFAFNNKSLLSRTAIVLAGPVANFILAVVVLWFMYLMGVKSVVPVVGEVAQESPAYHAGLQEGEVFISVDGNETTSWESVNFSLLGAIGSTKTVPIVMSSDINSLVRISYDVNFDKTLTGEEGSQTPLQMLGVEPWVPSIPAVIGVIQNGLAADKAGIKVGDVIETIDGERIESWREFVDLIRNAPGKELSFNLVRNNVSHVVMVTPGEKQTENNEFIGYLGVGHAGVEWPESYIRTINSGVLSASVQAIKDTWQYSILTLSSMYKMVVGLISVKFLGGPITIAQAASASMQLGLDTYMKFLAMMSVSLGVLNLLPVPVLDGGHLVYLLAEAVRGKPVSERSQELAARVGVAFIGGIMLLAFYNDVMRLL